MGIYVNYLIFRFGDTPYYPQSCSYRIEAFRKEMPQHAALHKNATTHKSINSGDKEWNSKHEASQSHSWLVAKTGWNKFFTDYIEFRPGKTRLTRKFMTSQSWDSLQMWYLILLPPPLADQSVLVVDLGRIRDCLIYWCQAWYIHSYTGSDDGRKGTKSQT